MSLRLSRTFAVLAVSTALTVPALAYGGMAMPYYEPPAQAFWDQAIAPNGAEVERLLRAATMSRGQADNLAGQDVDADGSTRQALYDEAIGALRQARRLDPTHQGVLLQLGLALEARGDGAGALEALGALDPTQDTGPEAATAMGRVYLRAGQLPEALRYLRSATSRASGWSYDVQSLYALALAQAGRLADGIDLLAPLIARAGYAPILYLTLASLYDRDEQLGRAYDTLTKMQSAMGSGGSASAQQAIGVLQLPTPERQYLLALAYETGGQLAEARTAWLNYAALGPRAHYAGRAEAHAAAIDAMLAARHAAKPAATKPKRAAPSRGARGTP